MYEGIWRVIDSLIYQIVMTLITIYTLFFDDFWVLALPVEADDYCFGIVCVIFIILSIDIFINFCIHKDYRFTFFFWLDVVSTLSLVADIGWLTASANTSDGGANAINATQLVKTTWAGRFTWLIRIIWIIWLIRILKLYK